MARTDEQQVIDGLVKVFRTHGFEGASLDLLSQATGLKRASLYYRFPGGKDEMAEAVLRYVDEWFESHVFTPLRSEGAPSERVARMAEALDDFYAGGREPCLLESLSLAAEGALMDHLRATYVAFRGALRDIALAAGCAGVEADRRAQTAMALIEGALILERLEDGRKPFSQVLKSLPDLLVGQN